MILNIVTFLSDYILNNIILVELLNTKYSKLSFDLNNLVVIFFESGC